MIIENFLYLKGYWEALCDYGIWKDGTRRIGCMENRIQEVMTKKLEPYKITFEEFMKIYDNDL